MFISYLFNRTGDPNFAIIVTDGRSNMRVDETSRQAELLRDGGVRVMVVGLGRDANEKEISKIASTPTNSNTFMLKDMTQDAMTQVAKQILDTLCS